MALETADVAFMADYLSKLPRLFLFSQRNWPDIRQNLVLSISVSAVLAHEVSEYIVIAIGLRLLRSH